MANKAIGFLPKYWTARSWSALFHEPHLRAQDCAAGQGVERHAGARHHDPEGHYKRRLEARDWIPEVHGADASTRHSSNLPVVDNGAVIGVLSVRDLLREIVEHHERLIRTMELEKMDDAQPERGVQLIKRYTLPAACASSERLTTQPQFSERAPCSATGDIR